MPPCLPLGHHSKLGKDEWEKLPMHGMEGDDIQRLPNAAEAGHDAGHADEKQD